MNQLKLAKVTPTIALGAKSLKAVIQNPYAAIFPEVRLEGQVIKKDPLKNCTTDTKNVRFAPNSSMNFHLDLGKQPLDAGTYIFTGRAILQQDEQQSWPFQQNLRLTLVKQKIESRSYDQMGPTHMVVTDFLHIVSNHNRGNL